MGCVNISIFTPTMENKFIKRENQIRYSDQEGRQSEESPGYDEPARFFDDVAICGMKSLQSASG
jgi:hypothetical protein